MANNITKQQNEDNKAYLDLLEKHYDINAKNNEILKRLTDSVESTEKLLSEFRNSIDNNTLAVNSNVQFWAKIVFYLVIILALLAGAEKIIPFLGGGVK